jgi:hypothetical protein
MDRHGAFAWQTTTITIVVALQLLTTVFFLARRSG